MKKEVYYNLVHIISILFLVYLTFILNNKFITLLPSLAFVLILKYYKRKSKKGQAAMEFLTTYGWAILILIVTVTALANFGVFRLPDQQNFCSVSAPFACVDVKVCTEESSNSNMISNVTIIANNVISMSVGNFISNTGTCTGVDFSRTPFNGNGQMQIALLCPLGNKNTREIGKFDLNYNIAGGINTHTTTLSYTAKREEGCGIGGGQGSNQGYVYREGPGLEYPWTQRNIIPVTWQSTEQAHGGSYSAKVEYGPWEEFYVIHGEDWLSLQPLYSNQYSAVTFWIYPLPTPGLSEFTFSFYLDNNIPGEQGNFPEIFGLTAPYNQWTQITLPMNQINPNNFEIIHILSIHNQQQNPNPPYNGLSATVYIDDLRFVPI